MISPSGSKPDQYVEKGNVKRAAQTLEDHLFRDMRPRGTPNTEKAPASASDLERMECFRSQSNPLAGTLLTDDTHKKTGYCLELERGSSTFKHNQLTDVQVEACTRISRPESHEPRKKQRERQSTLR